MTATYSVTRDQIIVQALRKLGALEPGDTSTSMDQNILNNAVINFNLMVKQWQINGIKLWTVSELTLPLVANQTTYTIGPSGADLTADKPMRLVQAFYRNTQMTPDIDVPLQIISKQEYNMLGSKFSTGTSNSVFMDVGLTSSTVALFLTPDTYAASDLEVHLVVQRPIADLNNSTDVPDFPNEWFNALVWGLADDMAIEFDVPSNHRQEIMMKATAYREALEDWDIENSSTFFQPDARYGMSR